MIWVRGVPRSGTMLMQFLLDSHPNVSCRREAKVVPLLVGFHTGMGRVAPEMARLREAHVTDAILSDALGAYLVSVLGKHRDVASRVCSSDPDTARSMTTISKALPRSLFLLLIRDGRATCHSLVKQKTRIPGLEATSSERCLPAWNRRMQSMLDECEAVGTGKCLQVWYEQLVLNPRSELKRILDFVELPWDEAVLRDVDVEVINQTDGISPSRYKISLLVLGTIARF